MRAFGTVLLLFALLLTLPAARTAAQPGVQRQELAPDVTFSEPFSTVSGLRELRDGRLIVADRLERAVRLVDMDSGVLQELGRVGQAPGEFQAPSRLLPLPDDSTLLVDFENVRLTVITPAGTLTHSFPMLTGDGLFMNPTGSDADGRLYFEVSTFMMRGSGPGRLELPDSAAIARWDPSSGAIDTVGYVRLPERGPTRAMRSRGGSMTFTGALRPFSPRDAWAVSPDGRVAVVSSNPYHVTWLDSDGWATVGPEVAFDPVRITRDDKNAWADRQGSAQVTMIAAGAGGGEHGGAQTMRMPRPEIDEIEWPEYKPPFRPEGIWVTPEGELWVEREVAFGREPFFDVFDRSGSLLRQVGLPAGRRIVGFGAGTVYAIRTDANDLQRLERYRR